MATACFLLLIGVHCVSTQFFLSLSPAVPPQLLNLLVLKEHFTFIKWRLSVKYFKIRDFRLPPRCSWDLHSSGVFFLDYLTLEEGTDMLSRNVGKGLPFDAALYPRRAQICFKIAVSADALDKKFARYRISFCFFFGFNLSQKFNVTRIYLLVKLNKRQQCVLQ
jgi:hypothetical protein